MNECLTTPQHEKQIGYWVSENGKCMKWLYHCGTLATIFRPLDSTYITCGWLAKCGNSPTDSTTYYESNKHHDTRHRDVRGML